MSNRRQTPRFPIWTLILDLIGTLVVGLGVYALVSSEEWRQYAIALIIFGVLMMLPLLVVLVQRAVSRR